MEKPACYFKYKGFTLIEITIAVTLLIVLAITAIPYFFEARERVILKAERDEIVNSLKLAQQKAIGAYEGSDYTIEFDKENNQYTLQQEGKTTSLRPDVEIEFVDPSTVTFCRVSGKLGEDESLALVLVSRKFQVTIQVNSGGIITTTNPSLR